MQFLLPLAYSALFIFLIYRTKFFESSLLSRTALTGLFILKLLAASAVWLIYLLHYSGSDFFIYFNDSAAIIHNFFNPAEPPHLTAWARSFDDSFFSGARSMIAVNVFLHLFSFGNFYVHSVFFCFFSFTGLVALLNAFSKHFPGKRSLVIALFFIPGILFWSSAPLKEALIIGACGLLARLTDFGLEKSYTWKKRLLVYLLLIFILSLKVYVFLALLPVLLVNAIVSRTSVKSLAVSSLLVFGGATLFATLVACISSDYNILRMISDRQAKAISEAKGGFFLASGHNFIRIDYDKATNIELRDDLTYKIKNGSSYLLWQQNNMADTTFIVNSKDTSAYKMLYRVIPAGSVIPLKKLRPVLRDYISYAPVAFMDTLLQPTFRNIHSWLQLVLAVENVWILILIILSLCFFDKRALEKKEVLFFCLVFSLIIFILVGITTPAIGAMVRYKTIGLLFLAAACFIMLDEKKLRRFFGEAKDNVMDDPLDLIDIT
jgi:hypothetical protein